MMIDRDQLIIKVAEKHRFILKDDEPLLAVVSMHDMLLEAHTNMLIQKLDEQTTRYSAGLKESVNVAKIEFRKEQQNLSEFYLGVHQRNIAEYRNLIDDHLAKASLTAAESAQFRNSSWLVLVLVIGFAALFLLVLLYLTWKT